MASEIMERRPSGGANPSRCDRLGPVTEERFRAVFEAGALATAKAAAALVGLDTDTLSEMTDAGIIRAVRKGRLRSYTEHDLRTFLLDGPDAPSRTKDTRAPSIRRGAVMPFSKRRGA